MTFSGKFRNIGLFGGTFDPVHQGHLTLARHVLDRCRLDTLLFIPAPQPPHKQRPTASFAHRVAMLEAALADFPARQRVQVSLIEEELPLPSYTINTVAALRQRFGPHRYFLVVGADSLLDLPHWHRTAELLTRINLIVVKRDTLAAEMVERMLHALDPSYTYNTELGKWVGKTCGTVEYLADVEVPVSSSAIRDELAQGRVPALLPPAVLTYVERHRLYGWPFPP